MSTTYHYVVLRLAVEEIRGEVINVGIALFGGEQPPTSIMMATLNKLRAIDATWNSARFAAWQANVNKILSHYEDAGATIKALGRFGFCEPDAVGMFQAEDVEQLRQQLAAIKSTYVSNKAKEAKEPREKRTRLQTLMRNQFKRMEVLGAEADDVQNHLVVANLPVPGYDELKNDFVYKNGVYRLTQALDYHVSPDSMHQKLMEVCLKSTAAELSAQAYGDDTLRMAVLDIPDSLLDAADHHVDMLLAKGFEVFHFSDSKDMERYLLKATPQALRAA